MNKQNLLRVIVVALAWASLAALAPAAHGSTRGQCSLRGNDVVTRHVNALCRSLARRAVRERPSRAWSASWTDRCYGVSDVRSTCTFRLVFRDRSEPKADRRPSRVCRGSATVTGRTRFRVKYDGGCVYPATYRNGVRS